MTSYKNLLAWQKAMLLVKEVYLLTKSYPKKELFALTSPTKRSAASAPLILLKVLAEEQKKILFSFFTSLEAVYMN
jgi:four helix bundle protein